MPTAFLCDFDGTIAPDDVGASLVRRFGRIDPAERAALLAAWKEDRIGHRRLTEAECEALRVTEDDALAFTRGFAIDPSFGAFARAARGRGDAVMVVSEGFDFYVRDLLQRAGLGELPVAANRARFDGNRVTAEFPHADPACGRCGNCKAQHVRGFAAHGYRTVLIGDGGSDRCGARFADAVFARDDLLAWCRDHGIAARPFESFADVHAAVAA